MKSNFMSSDPDTRSDAEKLADIIGALQRCFIGRLAKDLEKGHLSFPQYFLLGYLIQDTQLSMTEIAQKMGHTTAAATGIIDRLERLNYVKRARAANDRRKIFVKITKQGIALVDHVRQDIVSRVSSIMSFLTPQEQKAWLHIYQKIIENSNPTTCSK